MKYHPLQFIFGSQLWPNLTFFYEEYFYIIILIKPKTTNKYEEKDKFQWLQFVAKKSVWANPKPKCIFCHLTTVSFRLTCAKTEPILPPVGRSKCKSQQSPPFHLSFLQILPFLLIVIMHCLKDRCRCKSRTIVLHALMLCLIFYQTTNP